MAAIAPLLFRLREDTRGDHPSPEISFVEPLAQNRLISALQFSECEINGQQVKGDIGVSEFCSKTEHRVVDHHSVGFAQTGERPNFVPGDVTRIFWSTIGGNERDVAHDDRPLLLEFKNTQCVELFKVVFGMLTCCVNDPASSGVEGLTERRQISWETRTPLTVRDCR